MNWKIHALLIALVLTASALLAPEAQACRDCPFPMKAGDNQWLMPESNILVQIDEKLISDSSGYTMLVTLTDDVTGQILASGTTFRYRGQRLVNFVMFDTGGNKINATINWVSFHSGVIQAKFSCAKDECSIKRATRLVNLRAVPRAAIASLPLKTSAPVR